MVIEITIGVLVGLGLLAAFWCKILKFLNGWLRNQLERLLGVEKCQGYVKFLTWLDGKISPTRKVVLSWYRWFREKVLNVREHYRKTENGYAKTTTAVIEDHSVAEGYKEVVTEEEVPWEMLPPGLRAKLYEKNADEAEVDVTEVVAAKVKEKIAVMA